MITFLTALSNKQQQYLAYSLLLLLVTCFAYSYLALNQRYDEQLSDQLYQQHVMQRKDARYSSVVALPPKNTTRMYLRGATAAIAAANLQRDVQKLIVSNAGEVISVQAQRNSDDKRRAGIHVRFKASHQGLRNVLHKLETGFPVLTIDAMQLAYQQQQTVEGNLDVRLQVSGFLTEAER